MDLIDLFNIDSCSHRISAFTQAYEESKTGSIRGCYGYKKCYSCSGYDKNCKNYVPYSVLLDKKDINKLTKGLCDNIIIDDLSKLIIKNYD